jgi:hypothetical protein
VKFQAVIRGTKELDRKLREYSLEQEFLRALKESAILVHEEAVKSIQDHRSAGRIYRRGARTHVASAPGNPPNTDTGKLVRSIRFEIDEASLRAVVGTDLDYGRELEVKRDRAWLQPAYLKRKAEILKRFRGVRSGRK